MPKFKKAQQAANPFTNGSIHEVQRQNQALDSYRDLSDKDAWQLFKQGNEQKKLD